MPQVFDKAPAEKKDYQIAWSTWLPSGDTISTSTWTVPDGITEDDARTTNDTTTATIWLSGGTVGQKYRVVNSITTAQGRIAEDAIYIVMQLK